MRLTLSGQLTEQPTRTHRSSVVGAGRPVTMSSRDPRVRAPATPATWEDQRVERHALDVSGTRMSLATEARFVSEQQLHDAVAEFPETHPPRAIRTGPIDGARVEFPCAAGYIDLLLVDEFGRLVVCEVKKGAENTDVRRVIAQMLDYGAALWQTDIDAFETAVAHCEPADGRDPRGIGHRETRIARGARGVPAPSCSVPDRRRPRVPLRGT